MNIEPIFDPIITLVAQIISFWLLAAIYAAVITLAAFPIVILVLTLAKILL